MLVELVRFDLLQYSLTAVNHGTCNGLVWIGFFLWGAPSLAAGWQLSRANQKYLRLYREQVEPNAPSLEDIYERSLGAPWVWWVGIFSFSWWLRKTQRRPGATTALEAARRRVLFWRRVAIAIVFGGALFPLLICLFAAT